MGIKTIKVLRIISKVILAVFVLAFVGYGGLVTYKSIINRPERVRITNITDSAATITWVTKNPVRGVVYYNENGFFLPGPLSFIFGKAAYDDRDVSAAQEACVAKFNENAKNTKDANFSVDGSDFNCNSVTVGKMGAYYTHSITILNLNPETKYSFMVGNGIWSWSTNKGLDDESSLPIASIFDFRTLTVLESVSTPNISFGKVFAGTMSEDGYISEATSADSYVTAFLTLNDTKSNLVSAVTNPEGGWIIDKSSFRDSSGAMFSDLSNAVMTVCAQYENVNGVRCKEAEGDLTKDTEINLQGNLVDDLTPYEKSQFQKFFDNLVGKVYAASACSGNDLTKVLTGSDRVDCYTNCDSSYSVSGCGVTAKCAKKCDYVTRTVNGKWTNRDWVQFGTIAQIGCAVPSACGECAGGATQDDTATCKHRVCNSGVWSSWKDGLAAGGTCTPTSGGANCTGNDVCSSPNSCQIVAQGAYKHCLKVSENCYKWSTNTTACTTGGGGNSCTKGSTDCTSSSSSGGYYCSSSGTYYYHSSNSVVNGQKCSNGKWVPAEAEGTCSITPKYELKYDPGLDAGANTLVSCTIQCSGDAARVLSPEHCKKLSPNLKDSKAVVQPVVIDLSGLSDAQLELIGAVIPQGYKMIGEALDDIVDQYDDKDVLCGRVSGYIISNTDDFDKAEQLCKLLGGKWKYKTSDVKCDDGVNRNTWYCDSPKKAFRLNLVSPVNAESENDTTYALYMPEFGMYSFQLGNYTLAKEVSDGETSYIFYIETNGKAGFQMPVDPENPTSGEDIMITSAASEITYEKKTTAQKYAIQQGINIISFNFIPTSTDAGAYMASDIIAQAKTNSVDIKYISTFDGGRWYEAYSCSSGTCTGTDFSIVPGRGYLIYANNAGDITIPGYNLKSSIPVAFSSGWNLVGIHGYTTAYTARTLIDSINKIDGLTANNVSWWPTSKGKYEGLQVENNTEYGLDFAISPTNGYFVRISEFAPSDTTCKSILWNDGGTLNGTCGNTK